MSDSGIAIGALRLIPHRELRRGETTVAIGGRALAILSELAEADGALVGKDRLMERVWPHMVVEDNALQAQVSQLRKIMGAEGARLVVVHGRGYRIDLNRAAVTAAAPATPLVAILAFENRSSDPEMGYFAEGVSEEILQTIARIDGIRVIAQTSSFQMKGEQRRASVVATMLGATHILDGSVRRQENFLRIGAQLVEAASETVLWSERFDGSMVDVFAVQDRIARSVAEVLTLRMGPSSAKKRIDPLAYDFYLQGRRLTGPNEMRRRSIVCYEAALEIEPEFADAWGALALAHALHGRWDLDDIPFCERAVMARAAAEKALALNPSAAVAHLTFGTLEPVGKYRVIEEHFRRALHCAPHDSEVLRSNALFAYETGRINEAFGYVQRAFASDPLNPSIVTNYGLMIAEVGRLKDSYQVFANAHKRWPELDWFIEPIWFSAFTGDSRTLDALLAEPYFDKPAALGARRTALALRNPTNEVRRDALSGAVLQFERKGRVEISTVIFLYALGLGDEAFEMLERSDYSFLFKPDCNGDRHFMKGIQFSFTNRAMRDDPRFIILCEKLGLCAYWRETGRWPDCVDEVPYDFRAASMRCA